MKAKMFANLAKIEKKKSNKRGQVQIQDGVAIVMLIGLLFITMSVIALTGEKLGASLTHNSTAFNVTQDLNTEIGNNTSIAGIVLTISLISMILTVLIGVFGGFIRRGRGGGI